MSNGCGCERGGSECERKEADIALFGNMQRVSRSHSRMPFTLVLFTLIALLYYASVRLFGRFYFTYHE